MARGLINDHEYRQIDFPGEPYFTVRPPGVSLLLIPAALIAPYNIILSKITIILTAVIMLACLYAFMCRLDRSVLEESAQPKRVIHWMGLFILVLFATNPYILLYSTIVMSEIPFMAFTMAILYLLSNGEEKMNRRNLILLTCLLMFLPFLRTIGVALILALGMWAVVKRKRWPYLICVVCSCATTACWIARNNVHESQSYSSLTITESKSMGIIGTFLAMVNRSLNHYECLSQKIFPNMPGFIPGYERFVLDGYHMLPGPQVFYLLATIFVIAIAIYGMLKCWNRGGAVSFLYVAITFGILSLWPWIQHRYTLPLLPVILAFVPVGLLCLSRRLSRVNAISKKVLAGTLIAVGGLLLISQTRTDYSMITSNRLMLSKGEAFYQTEFPSTHFSNFVIAGDWLKNNTSEETRIITSQNSVAATALRFQKMVRFAQTNLENLHEIIQSFAPGYLVSYGRDSVGAFPWQLMDNDLVYRLTPVYEKSGVLILKITPNYEGTIRHKYWHEDESIEIAKQALAKYPNRRSFQISYLTQLLKAEKYDAAISFAEELQKKGGNEARIVNTVAWAYVGKREYKQALQEFEKASRMPGEKSIRKSLLRGVKLSSDQLKKADKSSEPDPSKISRTNLAIARGYWKIANFNKVNEFAQKVIESDQSTPGELGEAHLLIARFHLINGRTAEAVKELNQAITTENQEAKTQLEMVQREKSIAIVLKKAKHQKSDVRQTLEPSQRESIMKLVSYYEAQGVPGKSLKLLMQANDYAPTDSQVLKLLARYQLFYNLVPEAEKNYLQLQKSMPDDQDIKEALVRLKELKVLPRF